LEAPPAASRHHVSRQQFCVAHFVYSFLIFRWTFVQHR
jgi:hypothetical protein